MSFSSVANLVAALRAKGAGNIYVKALAENDNSKQQIYLGPNLVALQQLPLGRVYSDQVASGSILKADLRFGWLSNTGNVSWAPKAKLIFYPQYPEVRFSGFLEGVVDPPSKFLQPVPKALRKGKGPDGRMMVFGVTNAREIVGYLAPAASDIASELAKHLATSGIQQVGVFFELAGPAEDSRTTLLNELSRIASLGAVASCQLSRGVLVPCPATNPNSRGYTLEALLGIEANGRPDPDFLGWELKTVGKDKVTLLTTEPDGGVYGTQGPEAFLRRYGAVTNGKMRFVGLHQVGLTSQKTGLTLTLPGFDLAKGLLADPGQGMVLSDKEGQIAASWSYAKLTERWSRKHARSAYVSCRAVGGGYSFGPTAMLCEGTDIQRLLSAFGDRKAYYDPGTSLLDASADTKKVLKRRNQFRISVRDKAALYERSEIVALVT